MDWRKRSFLLIGGFALFRLLLVGLTGLGDSESYYWTWSRHLDWSYYDHPPVASWLMRFFTSIGGDTSFWVRLPSVLIFLGIALLLYRIVLYLFKDEEAAFWALLVFNICPLFTVAALQMVPDVPAALLWMVFVYLVSVILREGKVMLWYPAGAVLGLALLSKYMALPLIPATLAMLMVHREYRFHLRQPHIYLGGVLGLVCFSPVLIWNVQRDFPSFRFHLMDRHEEKHFELNHMGEFLGGQALYLSPLIWFGLLYICYRCYKSLFVEKDSAFAPLFWLGAPPLAFFMLIGLWTKESEPHWTAFGYLTPILAWGIFYVNGTARFRKYTKAAIGLSAFMVAAFYVHLFYPILPIKPKYDIVNELYGWDEAAPVIEKMMGELPGEKGKFLMAHHWVVCSQLVFATQNRIPVYCVNSRTDQFDFFPDKDPPPGADFIFVADNRFREPPDAFYDVEKVEPPVEMEIRRAGKWARAFYFYKVLGYKGQKP